MRCSFNKEHALKYLRNALNDPRAEFRDGQWESIEALLSSNPKLLVVQRTGWGKSMVYFMATKIMRERGGGPAILISPLLSLIRNQIAAAGKLGLKAVSINSTNTHRWSELEAEIINNEVDILIISPERLGNDRFKDTILSTISSNVSLFIVDEAHCISDWGHDFRPDFRQIVRIINNMPKNMPVLATTATANDRVVEDIRRQLGNDLKIQRGSLVRKSLILQNINMTKPAERLAWLAKYVGNLSGSGIIYTLTQRDSVIVSEWLNKSGIKAEAYNASSDERTQIEERLLNNEVKALVATVALGMGFDKPDLGFVIHYQRPASVVHYYQQVGRAGRALDTAYGILMHGGEDDEIADYFISEAFPPQKDVDEILNALRADGPLSVKEIEEATNLSAIRIKKALKYMNAEERSPIAQYEGKFSMTQYGEDYTVDQNLVEAITAIRRQEQRVMNEYMLARGCLMNFIQDALDDPTAKPCGRCVNCRPELKLPTDVDEELVAKAEYFLKHNHQIISPRLRWPDAETFHIYSFKGNAIRDSLINRAGRALCSWKDGGWGALVFEGKYKVGRFDDKLVDACVEMFKSWNPSPAPEWVACIPSSRHPNLVPDFAGRLAAALNIPFVPCIKIAMDHPEQKQMNNSIRQAKNLDGVFEVDSNFALINRPCLLIDDMVDSRWTFTIAGALLRQSGCPAVFPLALALNSMKQQ